MASLGQVVRGVWNGYGQPAANTVWNWVTWTDPLEVEATQEKLRQLIKEQGEGVFSYKFKAPGALQPCSPLKYAVMIRDDKSAHELIALRTKRDLVPATPSADLETLIIEHGRFAHELISLRGNQRLVPVETFSADKLIGLYVNSLSEKTPPDLEALTLLLKSASSDRVKLDHLKRALEQISWYKEPNWDLVAIFLENITDLSVCPGVSPFQAFFHFSYKVFRRLGYPTVEQELRFLENLALYKSLEEDYHQESTSALTVDQFKLFTTRAARALQVAAEHINLLARIEAQSLKNTLEAWVAEDNAGAEKLAAPQKTLQEIEKIQEAVCKELNSTLYTYRRLFRGLVMEGEFADCFEAALLEPILSTATRISEVSNGGRLTLQLLSSRRTAQ